MENIEKALLYLKKDILKNCDLITFIEMFPNEIKFYYCENDGVCFSHNQDKICISTDNEKVAEFVSKLIPKTDVAICKSYHDFKTLNEINQFAHVEEVYQFIFEKSKQTEDENIKKLTEDFAEFIVHHYSKETSIEEITSLMKHYNFYGYFVKGKLVAFIGRHIDGEIGFLEVLPDFRRKGIGTKLINKIVNEEIPTISYSQVLTDNFKSIQLHHKLGAVQYEKIVYWCY